MSGIRSGLRLVSFLFSVLSSSDDELDDDFVSFTKAKVTYKPEKNTIYFEEKILF